MSDQNSVLLLLLLPCVTILYDKHVSILFPAVYGYKSARSLRMEEEVDPWTSGWGDEQVRSNTNK